MTYTVFCVTNEQKREIYIGLTPLPMYQTVGLLRSHPPQSIKHWSMQDITQYRSLEFHLNEDEGRAKIAQVASMLRRDGWKLIVDRERVEV